MDEDRKGSLSIACISVVGGIALLNCIRSVLRSGLACVVVAEKKAIRHEVAELISKQSLEIIYAEGCNVPEKRAIAVSNATSDWLALIEDTCTVDDQWRRGCEALIACRGASAGSGPVSLGQTLSARARALYCSDYGKFFPTVLKHPANAEPTGMLPVETLPGVNLLYRIEMLRQYMGEEGLIESEVNRRMREDGHGLYIHQKLAVTLEHADENGATFRSRFTHGRLYGGLQSRNMTAPQRALRALVCVLLPLVLSCRSLRAPTWTRNRAITTAFYIVAFEITWSCGECTGYLLGCGHSLEDWK
jgi:hypothetical protein